MAAAPIELRQFMPLLTMEHVKAGIQGIRQQVSDGNGGQRWEMYHPPRLEYRLLERVHVDGKPALEWGEWQAVGFVREGDGATAEGAQG